MMDINKQSQSAGDNSTQIQADTINNTYNVTVTGIDEAAARRICQQEYAIAKQNWTEEALKIVDDRARQLEDKLMPKMIKYDNTLRIFADPSFQLTLRQAQISAAGSERPSDYEILSELLLHRAEHNNDRNKRLGVSEAINIVDKVSDEALVALSIFYAISKFSPVSDDMKEGLNVINELYNAILNGKTLPSNDDWMEHLDILSAIRISPHNIAYFKKLDDCIPMMLSKYLISGVLEDSDECNKIKDDFNECGISTKCLIPHPLKPNYVQLNNSYDIDNMMIISKNDSTTIRIPLNDQQKEAMKRAIDILRRDESNDNTLKARIVTEWDKYPVLKEVHLWWNSIANHFSITPIGMALANAYIQSQYPGIPSLY